MKILVDGVELFEISEEQKQVIKHYIPEDIFEDDMKRRLKWVIMHCYEEYYKNMKNEWDTKLIDLGVQSIPVDKSVYAQLVFSQPSYKNRSARDAEESVGE